jgi:hypothetical protein
VGHGQADARVLFVDAAAEGVVLALERYDAEPINLDSASEITIEDLAHLIARMTGFGGRFSFDPRNRTDNRAGPWTGRRRTGCWDGSPRVGPAGVSGSFPRPSPVEWCAERVILVRSAGKRSHRAGRAIGDADLASWSPR